MEKLKAKNAKELKEVSEILKFFPQNELNKISKNFLNYIEENKDDEYEFEWNEENEVNLNTVLPGTITLLQMIFLNYYASEEEAKEINEILDENERTFQQKAYEKYNIDIFSKKANEDEEEAETQVENNSQNNPNNDNMKMTIYKESIFKRIINSILNIFRRKR